MYLTSGRCGAAQPNPIRLNTTGMADLAAMAPFQAEKAEMRAAAKSRRAAAARVGPDPGLALADMFRHSIPLRARSVVAGYFPIGDEIDVRPLLRRLREDGHSIALPRVARAGTPLAFAAWREGDHLLAGPHGTRQPAEGAAAACPEVVILPMLAFDRSGFRLGYGGGYYDRTLAALRRERAITAVGVAFAAQEVESVPHGAHDQRLDWVVTEREALKTGLDTGKDH